jgi:hypothetical protein
MGKYGENIAVIQTRVQVKKSRCDHQLVFIEKIASRFKEHWVVP